MRVDLREMELAEKQTVVSSLLLHRAQLTNRSTRHKLPPDDKYTRRFRHFSPDNSSLHKAMKQQKL